MTVNEQLLQLNTDELSPLEALTKLAELKRLAATERAERERVPNDTERVRERLIEARALLEVFAAAKRLDPEAGEVALFANNWRHQPCQLHVDTDPMGRTLGTWDLRRAMELIDRWNAQDAATVKASL